MKRALALLHGWLFPELELRMEARLYRLLCLLFTFMSLAVIVPTNLIARLSPTLTISLAIFGLLTLGLFRLSLRDRYYPRTLLALMMFVVNLCWFANAGSQGTTVLFLFSVTAFLTIFFRGRERLTFLGFYLANGAALIWVHHRFPELVRPYTTPEARLPDFLAGFAVSTLGCVLLLWIILESHDTERDRLAQAKAKLEHSIQEIRTLQGMIPICAWCKKVRDDEGLWKQMEHYLAEHSEASFTHGICPNCAQKHLADNSGETPDQRP